jgi:phage terminase large subunit-like protein
VSTLAKKKIPAKWLAYAEAATQYARDIVDGRIPACKWVRFGCQRHLDDLSKARSKEFEYKFDPVRAGRVCAWMERFPHVKGKWARGWTPIHLEPWELFIVCSLFGWVNKKTGLRRFTEADIIVPRKNGKTILAALIALRMFVADGEPGAEVYCGASDKKQAKEVFTPASRMAKRAEGFKEYHGITFAKESMYVADDGSKFEIVIGNPGDGASQHCWVLDEYHEHPTDEQYQTARTGAMSREQPLLLVISTAGFDTESPCLELQRNLEQVLSGDITDDRLFGLIYTVDDPDRTVEVDGNKVPYWTTIDAVREANPNLGISVLEDRILPDLHRAVQRPNMQNSFKVKHLDIWTNAREAWMNMEAWKKQANPELSIDDFVNDPCYEGFDLGARIDLTSRCKIFIRGDADGKKHYYVFGRHYVPIDRAFDGEHQHYERWINESDRLHEQHRFFIGHPGPEIQLAFVQKEVEDELDRFNYQRMGFDQHQALQMEQELKLRLGQDTQGNDKVLDIPQNWKYLDPAMKEVEAAVLAGRFHHTGDPVLRWAVSNVVVKPDANENIFPRKENRLSKIDPASALFNAMYLAISAPVPNDEYISPVVRSV